MKIDKEGDIIYFKPESDAEIFELGGLAVDLKPYAVASIRLNQDNNLEHVSFNVIDLWHFLRINLYKTM